MTKKQRIITDYLGGMTCREVAEKYGRTPGGVQTSLYQWGVTLTPEERAKRRTRNFENTIRRSKPKAWPDCPEHLREDYETLCRYFPKREARMKLEGGNVSI